MAVTVISRPNTLISAYTPVEYTFSSTFAGFSGAISNIREGAAENTIEVVVSNRLARSFIIKDGTMTLTNTTSSIYDGEFIVLDVTGSNVVTLDTPFISTESGGNFSYTRLNTHMVVDLYMGGNFIIRKQRFPNVNDQFVFDFSKEIQINLGNNLAPLPVGVTPIALSGPSSASIHVRYADSRDRVIDGVAEPTLALDKTLDPPDLFDDSVNNRRIINATVPYVEWEMGSVKSIIINKDTDLSAFVVDSVASNRFLTNSPKTIPIGRTDAYQLSFIVDFDAGKLYKHQIITYDSTGAVINTSRQTFTPANDGVWISPIGTRNLGATITALTVKYDVSIVDANDSNNNISEVITFEIDDKCHATDTRFVWLNSRGGYDAYTFHSPRKLNSSVRKITYNPPRQFPVVVGNSEERTSDVQAEDSISTGTNKVTKERAEWIQELLESPEVFIELSADNALHNKRVPVTLINKTRAITDSYKGLHNVNLRYKFGFKKIGLRAS